MKAITTKFHGPTDTRGSRYSARDMDGNRVSVSANYALNSDQNHREAVRKLCDKMKWDGVLVEGSIASSGYVYVFLPYDAELAVKDRNSTDYVRVGKQKGTATDWSEWPENQARMRA